MPSRHSAMLAWKSMQPSSEHLILDTETFCPYHRDPIMKLRSIMLVSAALLATTFAMKQPSFHTKGEPTGKPAGPLTPCEYWWHPEISPQGPVVVLVSIPQQTMHV